MLCSSNATIDEYDWPLVHMTVRSDVAAGKYGATFVAV